MANNAIHRVEKGTQSKFQRLRSLSVSALVLAIFSVVLSPSIVAAQQQNEIALSVDFDGTAGFSGADPLDDGAGGHTPGLDLNDNNNVVRTFDQIQYRIDWNVNEVDGTTTTIRMTLPVGVEWLPDATTNSGVPSGCLDDGTSSITGLNGRELVCNTDAEHEGSNGAIHPRAFVNGFLDGTPLTVTAEIETDQLPPVVSNPITTTVSAAPSGDWIKGEPLVDEDSGDIIGYVPDEEYFNVLGDDGSTNGRLFVWNLRLEPAGGLKGSEPLNDAIPIQFWDHFFDAVPGTVLATPAQLLAATGVPRVPCGGYDGDGPYPFGVTAGAAATTPAAQTNVGTWTCTDQSATNPGGYPLVQIDITGQDTTNIAPQNANLGPNNTTLASGQIAFWAPEDQLQAKPVPRIIVNAITGTTTVIPLGTVEVDPIQIEGFTGPVDEISESGSGLAGQSNSSPYEFPAGPVGGNPGRSFDHYIRYQNGPYQEVQWELPDGAIFQTYDNRVSTAGGTGRVVNDGANGIDQNVVRWDGDGQTPRGNILTVHSSLSTVTTRDNGTDFFSPIHSCVAVDTTHQEVVGLPPTFPISERANNPVLNQNQETFNVVGATIGGSTGTPATPIAQVLAHETGGLINNFHWNQVPTVQVNSPELDWTLEVAAGTAPGNAVLTHDVTCNEGEADGRGWVNASTGDLSVFQTGTLPDGTPIYGDVTHFRVRTAGDVPWNGPRESTTGATYGAKVQLNFQVRVKDDPTIQVADQELFVYQSRASGEWDGTGQPPTPSCTAGPAFPGGLNTAIPLGWCNLDFTDDGADTLDTADFQNDYDSSAVELVDVNGTVRLAHADVVYIVEPALAISKVNTDGPSDITANGQTVEFEINPRVVGSSLDTINNITVTDVLPATMTFVGFTSQPPGSPCSHSGGTITCNYGDQAGGWGSLGEGRFSFEVVIGDAGPNATLTNTATISGVDSQLGTPVTPASSRAQAFTGAPFEESDIEKFVAPHITNCFEAPGTIHDPGDCTVIAADGGLVYTHDVQNEGNVDLTDYRLIDVFPYNGDVIEPASGPHPFTGVALTGDGRTPASSFSGSLDFVNAVVPPGATVLYTADAPATVSRDPLIAEAATTWCTSPAGGAPAIAGLGAAAGTGACPAAPADVTAIHIDLGTLDRGATEQLEIQFTTVGAVCGDIWTNNFGARTPDILLSIRSNDVSVMAGFCEPSIDIEKATNGLDSDTPDGAQIVAGDPVTWTYEVTNDGDVALANATVTDVPAPVGGISCDVDGDGALDGTNIIPILLPGESVTCEATGTALPGPFSNNASVTGEPVLPDFSDPSVDPSDPSTWPTDAASFSPPIDPVTGEPALDDVDDEDPSHYTGIELDPEIDIEKDTNGAQSDTAPGETLVAGQAVTWTYVVENTGNAALLDAAVTDVGSDGVPIVVDCDIDGDGVFDGTNIIPLLVPSASVTCQSTGVAGPGPYSNNATVSGNAATANDACVCDPTDPSTWPTDPSSFTEDVDPATGGPLTVDDEDPSNYTGVEPGVDIEKDTNGVQSDTAPGETLFAGAPVTWTYVVANTGGTALLDAVVADSDPSIVVDCDVDGDGAFDGTSTIPFLAVGASVTCQATGTAITGAYTNTATVSGTPALPDFSDPAVDPSDPTTWPTDPAAYSVPTDPDGNPVGPVDDADDSNYFGAENGPAVDIEKDTNGAQSDEAPGETLFAGAPVTWTYVVTNTGNTALANAVVADSDPAITVDCDVDGDGAFDGTDTIPFLALGGSVTCQATGTAITGAYTNTATVSGAPITPDASLCGCDPEDPSTWPTDPALYTAAIGPDGLPLGPVDDADDSNYTGAENGPGVDIEKDTNGAQSDTAPGESITTGDAVTWTYVVTNTGNTALLDAVVDDSDPAVTPNCDVDGDGVLDGTNVIPLLPFGASVTCEATGTAIDGAYTNTANISGTPATPDPATCGCDPDDPSTWPTDAASYLPAIGPDGEPLGPVGDSDDSNYTGVPLPAPAIPVLAFTGPNALIAGTILAVILLLLGATFIWFNKRRQAL